MITVVIHTHEEAHNIEECIESARLLTSNIIVIDMNSTDGTAEKAEKLGVPVVQFPFSYYVEPARNFGIQQVKTDWLLILDADERVTKELAAEIKSVIDRHPEPARPAGGLDSGSQHTHFKIPRKNVFGHKKWLQHGGWWPDHQLRLINKRYFKDWPERIHATPTIEGEMGYLNSPIIHYFHGDLEKMVEKTIIFENIESELLFKANRPVTTSTFFRKYMGELFRRLVKKAGFMDGTIGIIESMYQAFSKTITYLYLYEKKKSSTV